MYGRFSVSVRFRVILGSAPNIGSASKYVLGESSEQVLALLDQLVLRDRTAGQDHREGRMFL